MSPRHERLAWLVESDMPVHANPEQQEIQTTGCRDRLFVTFTLDIQIGCDAVEAVGSIRIEIDPRQQMLGQESSKAARLRRVETNELVEEKRRRLREVGLPC